MARLLRRANEHEQVEALLSAYLDDQVSAAERARVEQHIASCADCAQSLATLRATVAAVRAMPRVRAPRSFTLPQTMAQKSRNMAWMYPLLRGAAVAAASLFAIVVAGDLFAHVMLRPSTTFQMAAPAASQPPVADESVPGPASLAAAPESTATPVPRVAVPATPSASTERRLPSASTAQPLGLTTAPAPPVKAVPQVTPPASTAQPVYDAGLGTLFGTPSAKPSREFAAAVTAIPLTSTPLATQTAAAPMPTARISAPQPLSARPEGPTGYAQPQAVNAVRIFEGALAALALALGVATLIVRRLGR